MILSGFLRLAVSMPIAIAAGPARADRSGVPHSTPGGIGGVTRANYGVTATGSVSGIGTIALPHANVVYLLPLSVTNFAESTDVSLLSDGTVQINTSGLYRVALCVDWPGQHGVDMDLRYYGIGRLPIGSSLGGTQDGDLLNINTTLYDRLAIVDIPGSDPPTYARAQVQYSPGTLQPGGTASIDVTLPQTGIVGPGDIASVSDTALTDAKLGSGNSAIALSARVVAPNVVRVFFDNLRGAAAVTIPAGTINILAGSSIDTRGESADAWNVIQSPTVLLYAGERIFGVFKSKTKGDFLQVSNQTYLQVELLKAAN